MRIVRKREVGAQQKQAGRGPRRKNAEKKPFQFEVITTGRRTPAVSLAGCRINDRSNLRDPVGGESALLSMLAHRVFVRRNPKFTDVEPLTQINQPVER